MRKSLGLVVGLVSLFSAACGGLVDGSSEDGVAGKSESAFGRDPNVIIPPAPTANPVQNTGRIVLQPISQGPYTVWTPPPPPVLATVSGWAGYTGMHGHTDGSGYTSFDKPTCVAALPNGLTWVLDQDLVDPTNTAIRLITPTRGTTSAHVATIVKQSATDIALWAIGGMAADPNTSDLYVTETFFNRIVKIGLHGDVTVVTGTASTGFNAQQPYAEGNSATARFSSPTGIARAANGTFYVADTNNRAIRMVTTAGDTTLLAFGGAGFYPKSIALDPRDNTVYATVGNAVYSVSPAGVVALYAGDLVASGGTMNGLASAARFDGPQGLAVDRSGNVYVADTNNHALRKIIASVSGSAVTVETVPPLTPFDPTRWIADGYGYDENGLEQPFGLAFMGDRLVFSDATRPTIRIAN